MKKLFNILLVLVMLLTIVPVNAASVNPGSTQAGTKGKITITYEPKDGETPEQYSIYRILDLNSYDKEKGHYSYVTNTTWFDFIYATSTNNGDAEDPIFTIGVNTKYAGEKLESENPTHKDGWVVTVSDAYKNKGADIAELALEWAKNHSISANENKTATVTTTTEGKTGTAVFDNLDLGYYLVESTMGIVCSLTSTDNEIEIEEKNETPTPDKTVTGGVNAKSSTSNSVSVGDTVNYVLTLEDVYGFKNVKGNDTLSEGLTLDAASIKVYNDDKELEKDKEYTLSVNGNTFVVTFKDWYTTALNVETGNTAMKSGDTLTVKYNAVVNEKAKSTVPNTNEFNITFGNGQKTDKVETETITYEFTLEKTDGENDLSGANFVLYRLEKDVKVYAELTKTTKGYQIVKFDSSLTEKTATTIEAGTVVIEGLGNGTYYLTETKAPEGYNKLAEDIDFTIENANMEDALEVINTTGAVLPSTGGMGTVLFITIGSLMVLGFGVLLVTKFRMSKELA